MERDRVFRPFALNLSENNLNEKHLRLICRALFDRKQPLNLGALDLSVNHNINDDCARVLFRCIGLKCPRLESIDISYANITDIVCDVIYDFYGRYVLDRNRNRNRNQNRKRYRNTNATAKRQSTPSLSRSKSKSKNRVRTSSKSKALSRTTSSIESSGGRKSWRRSINGKPHALSKLDLSFTRISENGLLTLDELFNEIPKSMEYIHNDFESNSNQIETVDETQTDSDSVQNPDSIGDENKDITSSTET